MSSEKYNKKLAGLWQNKLSDKVRLGGMYKSMLIDDEVFDALQGVEKGGKLVFKVLLDESRSSEKSPHGYLEYMSPEQVAAEQHAYEAWKASKGGAATPAKKAPARKPAEDDI